MEDNLLKILGSILILICCLIFGILPLKLPHFRSNKKLLAVSNAFAGGLFLAIGLIHILPEAHDSLEGNSKY